MKPFRKNRNLPLDKLKLLAPGTDLHRGLESILRAKTGALIVLGYNEEVARLSTGGFSINHEFSSSSLYELCKMDGAVIVSGDAKKILFANVELTPLSEILTRETGIRHRSAERTAKQTGLSVLAVSKRRDVITLFHGEQKYVLEEMNKLLAKANQGLQTLEKYRRTLDEALRNLNVLEVNDRVTLGDVCHVVKLMELVYRVAYEVEVITVQLGSEGRLVRMQLEELRSSLDAEYKNAVTDYEALGDSFVFSEFEERMEILTDEVLLDHTKIAGVLGYNADEELQGAPLVPRGYRQLSHIPRLPQAVIANVISHHGDLQGMLLADSVELEEVDGVGEIRARAILDGFKKLKDISFGREMYQLLERDSSAR